MYTLLIILTLLAAFLLIGAVLIQRSKGGGLSSSFAGSNQIMGVRRTNSFIEKATWILAGCIALFAILSVFVMPTGAERIGSRVNATATQQQQIEGGNFDTQAPVLPATPAAPAAETPAAEAPAETPAE